MPTSSHPSSQQPAPGSLRNRQAEQEKDAVENNREGFGSTVKSKIISGKPDGDTQGGPGANNDNGNRPAAPSH